MAAEPANDCEIDPFPKGRLDFEARKGLSPIWEMYHGGPGTEELTDEEMEWIENEYAKIGQIGQTLATARKGGLFR